MPQTEDAALRAAGAVCLCMGLFLVCRWPFRVTWGGDGKGAHTPTNTHTHTHHHDHPIHPPLPPQTCIAVNRVLAGEAPAAFCVVRPPGHHATPTRAMGFCFFNSAGVAALHARAVHGLQRVACVDVVRMFWGGCVGLGWAAW